MLTAKEHRKLADRWSKHTPGLHEIRQRCGDEMAAALRAVADAQDRTAAELRDAVAAEIRDVIGHFVICRSQAERAADAILPLLAPHVANAEERAAGRRGRFKCVREEKVR